MSENSPKKSYAGTIGMLLIAGIGFGVAVIIAELFPESLGSQEQLVLFAGPFHPLTVHLPIGFFAALFLLETLTLLRVTPRQGGAEGMLLFGGTAAAMLAALLGICLASGGDYEASALAGHRRMGLALAFGSVAVGFLKVRVWSRGGFFAGLLYWGGLLLLMGLLAAAGHQGGAITHGDDFLTQHMPEPLGEVTDDLMARIPDWLLELMKDEEPAADPPPLASPDDNRPPPVEPDSEAPRLAGIAEVVAAPPPEDSLEDAALEILESRCLKCHGEKKKKGKLRLDSLAAAVRGGRSGEPAIVGGDPMASELVFRITLPVEDEDVMPPEGKKRPTPEEILVLIHWIDAGAPWDGEEAPGLEPEEDPAGPAPAADDETRALVELLGERGMTVQSLVDAIAADRITRETLVGAGAGEPASARHTSRRGPVELPAELVAALAALNEKGAIAMPLGQDTTDVGIDFSLARAGVTDATLELLVGVAGHLRHLDLTGTAITDAGMSHLAGLTALRKLHLARTGIDGSGLVHLAGLTELEVLNLYGTRVTAASLSPLAALAKLERMYLFESAVDREADAESIAELLPGVEVDYGWTLEDLAGDAATLSPAEVIANFGLASFFDEGGCCDKAHAGEKVCDHPCCVAALESREVCAKCNAEGSARRGELVRFDFETGDLQGWRIVEGAFARPVSDQSTFRDEAGVTYVKQGRWFLSTLDREEGAADDKQTGVIESPVFELAGAIVTLRVGGGDHENTHVALCALDGAEIVRATGKRAESIEAVKWELDPSLIGQQVYLRVVDGNQDGWGHLTLDHVEVQGKILPGPSEQRFESRTLVLPQEQEGE